MYPMHIVGGRKGRAYDAMTDIGCIGNMVNLFGAILIPVSRFIKDQGE
jgi:hypothetical protein